MLPRWDLESCLISKLLLHYIVWLNLCYDSQSQVFQNFLLIQFNSLHALVLLCPEFMKQRV